MFEILFYYNSRKVIVKHWFVIYKVIFYKVVMWLSYQNLIIIIIRLDFEKYFQIYGHKTMLKVPLDNVSVGVGEMIWKKVILIKLIDSYKLLIGFGRIWNSLQSVMKETSFYKKSCLFEVYYGRQFFPHKSRKKADVAKIKETTT